MPDDARISTTLPAHPKTVKLQRRLGAEGCWFLIRLFLFAADSRPSGDLSGMSIEDIEIAAGWPGADGALVHALVEVRFLDGCEGKYRIHDWETHNPWAANRPQRVEASRAAARARWGKVDANSMRTACDSHETAMPHSPLLSSPPITTHTTKSSTAVAVPDWIPTDAWTGFIEMRSKARAKPTSRAIALILKQLEKLRGDGFDVGAVLDQSTRNGWKDVFPVRSDSNGTRGFNHGAGPVVSIAERNRAAAAQFERERAQGNS